MASPKLTLTNSLIDDLCQLVRIGVSPTAAALHFGISRPALDMWKHVGRNHIATGQATLQAAFVKRLEAAQTAAKHIDWHKMYEEAPEYWLTLYPLVDKIEMAAVRRQSLPEEVEAALQQKCQEWYAAWKKQQGGSDAKTHRT